MAWPTIPHADRPQEQLNLLNQARNWPVKELAGLDGIARRVPDGDRLANLDQGHAPLMAFAEEADDLPAK